MTHAYEARKYTEILYTKVPFVYFPLRSKPFVCIILYFNIFVAEH